jgi:tRNA A-37 threonylcarbamoyl transferase component Bud32
VEPDDASVRDPGDTLEDRYTDLTEIGRGAYSIVYRAFSPAFNREVAIKVFAGHVTDEDLRRRFQRECQVIGTLGDHPHVVSVFDSGFTAEGQPYLVMAYCGGGSFGQRLAGQGPRPPEEAAVVGIAVADALAAAHERGIVHRDVKPQNVLLTGYGVVALADFGVATGPAGDLRSFAATPGYVAPEVVLGDGGRSGGSWGSGTSWGGAALAGPEADVYSVGATMYALLTGGPPIRPEIGEPDEAYLLRSAEAPVPPLPASVPEALGRIVLQCLRKEPYHRPSSAAVLRRLLRLAAAEDELELPERLDVLPVPASFGGAAVAARTGGSGPGTSEYPLWPRRLAVVTLAACLVGGLVAAGDAVLGRDGSGAGAGPGPTLGAPDVGVPGTGPTGPDGQVRQQRGDTATGGDGTRGGTQPVGASSTAGADGGGAGSPGGGTAPAEPEPGAPTSGPTSGPTSAPTSAPTATPTASEPAESATKTKKPKKPKKPRKKGDPAPTDDAAA